MFWTSQYLKQRQHSVGIITPFVEQRVKHGAYEMTLSREALVTPSHGDVAGAPPDKVLAIPPGQMALLFTVERVTIPDDVIAFISIKASLKLGGLINVSGFHVDPGFCGKLKFSVYNAGPEIIFLDYERETFLIWFAEMATSVEDPYNGNHKNQGAITVNDRRSLSHRTASPAALDERLQMLEFQLKIVKSICKYLVVPLLVGLIVLLVGNNGCRKLDSPTSAPISRVLQLHLGDSKQQPSVDEPQPSGPLTAPAQPALDQSQGGTSGPQSVPTKP